ncbi:Nuclear distribution protein nudE-like protein [Smittium culicis]|uniref:Nuclear distribution protein nudE-like protein n=1 Tax=Smittium culicis TaxID=133412 RepID=A0A1R1YGR2_9FUNG|nr:Nuclear distribution protein nudE-like protein [Smittium culicis]
MDPLDFQDPTSFPSNEDELQYWKTAAFNARDAYVDSQLELETVQKQAADTALEYENDIKLLENANKEMRTEIERLKAQVENWREKYKKERMNSEDAYQKSERELQFLKSQQDFYKSRTRELEQDNDDLEKSERAIKSSLHDAQVKVKGLSQTNEFLMGEVKSKQLLVEEVQRLKDDLRDLNVELSIVRGQKSIRGGRASLGGFKVEPQTSNTLEQDKTFKDVMNRMKGLESKIESARSLVSPLLQESRKYQTSTLRYNPDTLARSRTIGSPNANRNRMSSVFESSTKELPRIQPRMDLSISSTKLAGTAKNEEPLTPISFAASSESSRLRMARSRALRNEVKSKSGLNNKDDHQTVPTSN